MPPDDKLPKGEYPPIGMGGFVADYQIAQPPFSPQIVMDCQDSNNLPILNQLAAEFMVCDHWFSALPGPTWPNRFFIHAASATGETDSAGNIRIFEAWIGWDRYTFHLGTIYDALAKKHLSHQIYVENTFSQVICIGNQTVDMSIKGLESFEKDISDPKFPHSYVFIEPNSGEEVMGIGGGTEDNMHPPSDMLMGEVLVRRVYEGLRNSPLWDTSVLVIMFDEHGGFFDHVPPPKVRPLDDGSVDHKHGFRYDQLGVRVPALIISPWVGRNTIDHTVYEHSSHIASIVRQFGLEPLTSRDRDAADFLSKLSEKSPRTDAPTKLASALDACDVTQASVPELLAFGQTGEVTITFLNTGATVWTKERGYKLIDLQPVQPRQQATGSGVRFPWLGGSPVGPGGGPGGGQGHDATVTPASIDLPSDVPPGESVTFHTSIKASNRPGCMVFQWGMTREGIHNFGQRTNPLAVVIGTSPPQLDTVSASFHNYLQGLDAGTVVEASLFDESKEGGPVASFKSTSQSFTARSITNWFQMSPGANLGRFAECQPRYVFVQFTPKGHESWAFAMYLMLNWTGGCSVFLDDSSLSATQNGRFIPLIAPNMRIAFKTPAAKGAQVTGVTTLTVEAQLDDQLQGIEFSMDYVTVAGKHASFLLGVGKDGPDGTITLSWDSSNKLPKDRSLTALDVTLVASAIAEPGSKLWVGRDTPRASLPVHLG